jgi:hypothetical protein
MAKKLTNTQKQARVVQPRAKSSAARRQAVKSATSKVKARATIDFPRSVRST